jgi:hypothetical protein
MPFFLIMSPFVTFAALSCVTSLTVSLVAAAAVAAALTLADYLRGASIKLLSVGPMLMFTGLACYFVFTGEAWNIHHIHLALDSGVLTIALVSIALGRPFTLQYARERVDEATTREAGFLRVNYVLSWVWAGAMSLVMAADMLVIYTPWFPLWAGVAVAFVTPNSAVRISKWYPRHLYPDEAAAQ